MTKSDQSILDLALPYQRKFILNQKKRKLWLSSRQIGKSWTLAFLASFKALDKKNGLSLCISTGGRAAQELIHKVHQFAEAVKILTNGQIDYVPSADSCKFSNGSRVVSLPSGNPTALRGWSAQAVLIDECAFIERPYDVLQAISPTLTRDKNAELIVASTPAGKQGLFWDLYNDANEEWYVQTTTIEDAIADGLDVDVTKLRSLCPDPDKFAQEYECKWLSDFGAFIDPQLLVFADKPNAKVRAKYCGYDVGGSGDRTAIATIDELEDGTYFLEDIVVLQKTPYSDQLNILKSLHENHKWSSGYVDSQGIGNPIAEFANKNVSARIQGFAWSGTNKTPVLEHTRSLIMDRKLVISEHLRELIVSDFRNIDKIVTEDGKVKYVAGHDANGHSDAASAVFLALWAAHENPSSFDLPHTYMRPSPFGAYGGFGNNGCGRLA